MSFFKSFFSKYRFDVGADRIGPDILFTYWRVFFKSTMRRLCERKFYRFGHGAEIRPGVYVVACSKVSLGNNVVLRPGTLIHAESSSLNPSIIIEDDVLVGSGVQIYVENHRFDNVEIPIYYQGHQPGQQVILRKGCWLGANVIVLPGVVVGQNSVVAAGSVVTKDVPAGHVVAGVPARVIKQIGSLK